MKLKGMIELNKLKIRLQKILKSFFGHDADGVFYVGGPDVLPAPLSPEEEAIAIAGMKDDPALCDELISHNLRLVVYISKTKSNTS